MTVGAHSTAEHQSSSACPGCPPTPQLLRGCHPLLLLQKQQQRMAASHRAWTSLVAIVMAHAAMQAKPMESSTGVPSSEMACTWEVMCI